MNKSVKVTHLIFMISFSLLLCVCNETQNLAHEEFALPNYCKLENAIIYDPANRTIVEIDKDAILKISTALESAKKISKNQRGFSYFQIGFGDSLKPATPTVIISGKNTFSFNGVFYQKENVDLLGLTRSIVKEGRTIKSMGSGVSF